MKERDYPEGIDCVWIGSDRKGRIGVFATGGEGPIPSLALHASRTPVEEIEGMLLQLTSITSGQLRVELKRPDDFLELARRGLFAYDWADVHRTRSERVGGYELISSPVTPLLRSELPSGISSLLDGLQLDVDFGEEDIVDPSEQLQCREPKTS